MRALFRLAQDCRLAFSLGNAAKPTITVELSRGHRLPRHARFPRPARTAPCWRPALVCAELGHPGLQRRPLNLRSPRSVTLAAHTGAGGETARDTRRDVEAGPGGEVPPAWRCRDRKPRRQWSSWPHCVPEHPSRPLRLRGTLKLGRCPLRSVRRREGFVAQADSRRMTSIVGLVLRVWAQACECDLEEAIDSGVALYCSRLA